LDPPEQTAQLALRLLPALVASLYSAASAVLGAIPHARKAALLDTLPEREAAAMSRYIEHSTTTETRWLVLRVFGVAGSAVALYPIAPGPAAFWTIAFVLVAYALPSEILSALGRRVAERAAPWILVYVRPLELLVSPIAAVLSAFGRLATGRVEQREPPSTVLTETEVEILVNEGELNGSLAHDQSEMIRNVLDFGDTQAGDIMVPRVRVSAIESDARVEDIVRVSEEKGYSRYPVYRDRIDNVVGFLHVKDLVTRAFTDEQKATLRASDLMRTPVVYVPEAQLASSVLKDMRSGHKHHIAIVIDEFGGMSGIITLEDIIERIVGDIRDEHDDPEEAPPITKLDEGRLLVDASMPVADLSRHLEVELPEDGDYYSLGGFMVESMGRVPQAGDVLNKLGFDFVVREADERHISKVEVVRTEPPPQAIPKSSSSRRPAA
jgi:magnesium and cobalt exporter, CNNM family